MLISCTAVSASVVMSALGARKYLKRTHRQENKGLRKKLARGKPIWVAARALPKVHSRLANRLVCLGVVWHGLQL